MEVKETSFHGHEPPDPMVRKTAATVDEDLVALQEGQVLLVAGDGTIPLAATAEVNEVLTDQELRKQQANTLVDRALAKHRFTRSKLVKRKADERCVGAKPATDLHVKTKAQKPLTRSARSALGKSSNGLNSELELMTEEFPELTKATMRRVKAGDTNLHPPPDAPMEDIDNQVTQPPVSNDTSFFPVAGAQANEQGDGGAVIVGKAVVHERVGQLQSEVAGSERVVTKASGGGVGKHDRGVAEPTLSPRVDTHLSGVDNPQYQKHTGPPRFTFPVGPNNGPTITEPLEQRNRNVDKPTNEVAADGPCEIRMQQNPNTANTISAVSRKHDSSVAPHVNASNPDRKGTTTKITDGNGQDPKRISFADMMKQAEATEEIKLQYIPPTTLANGQI